MSDFSAELANASMHAHNAKDRLSGTTTHLIAYGGLDNLVDLDFFAATTLKTLARALREATQNPNASTHTKQVADSLIQATRDAMNKHAEAARKTRELVDLYRQHIGESDFDERAHLNGQPRK